MLESKPQFYDDSATMAVIRKAMAVDQPSVPKATLPALLPATATHAAVRETDFTPKAFNGVDMTEDETAQNASARSVFGSKSKKILAWAAIALVILASPYFFLRLAIAVLFVATALGIIYGPKQVIRWLIFTIEDLRGPGP